MRLVDVQRRAAQGVITAERADLVDHAGDRVDPGREQPGGHHVAARGPCGLGSVHAGWDGSG
eukprot:scaffold19118_cov59-Phaeocystis_antarctica.AAC.1